MIDLFANGELFVTQLAGEATSVVSETTTPQQRSMSFEEQQDELLETLQSFEPID